MEEEIYDKVANVSEQLNELLDELKECEKEKQSLLDLTSDLTNQGMLAQHENQIRAKMADNLERYKKTVRAIEQLNKSF